MSERHHVEIDYCPNCRGIWLDKGELDKLLDFAANQNNTTESQPKDNEQNRYGERLSGRYGERSERNAHYEDQQYRDKHKYNQQYPRKKKSFLSDFFDFD
jgi:Zn-finger nucleic acid-binding protein